MGTRADQSTWLIERGGKPSGYLDLMAVCPPPARGLAQYWFNRSLPFTAGENWTAGDRIREPHFCGPFIGASLILNRGDDLELVAAQQDGSLAHFQHSGIHGWRGPVFLPGSAAGPPAFIRSRFGNGNYEVIAPRPGGGLSHFWRDNTHGEAWREAAQPSNAGSWSGVGLIHSRFGNLEVAGVRDGRLVFLWQNGEGGRWSVPQPIPPAVQVVGRPAFLESSYGNRGSFEVIVARAGGLLAHLWRNNDAANFPWAQARVFGADRRGRTRTFDDVTAIQTSSGRLEVAARLAGSGVIEHFRATLGAPWEGPGRALVMRREQEQTGGLAVMA